MGRDKPKKFNKMDYHQKQSFFEKELRNLGSSPVYYPEMQGRGSATRGMIDLKRTQAKFENLSRNDFDYRTSAQHMDGVKGNASAKDYVNYQRSAQKLHKKAGNGGQYSSNEDITTVTNNLVNDYNNSITDKLDNVTKDINGLRDDIETRRGVEEQSTADPQSFEHSDAVSKAQDNLEKYKLNLSGRDGLFAKSNEPAPRADDQSDATQSFADQYKMDVSDASDLGEVKARNLNNAIATVKSYRQ